MCALCGFLSPVSLAIPVALIREDFNATFSMFRVSLLPWAFMVSQALLMDLPQGSFRFLPVKSAENSYSFSFFLKVISMFDMPLYPESRCDRLMPLAVALPRHVWKILAAEMEIVPPKASASSLARLLLRMPRILTTSTTWVL